MSPSSRNILGSKRRTRYIVGIDVPLQQSGPWVDGSWVMGHMGHMGHGSRLRDP